MQIHDAKQSKPILMNTSTAFVWEVIVYGWDDNSDQQTEDIDAVFFDPWKAVQYGIDHYQGMCMVQVVLLHTDNLTA